MAGCQNQAMLLLLALRGAHSKPAATRSLASMSEWFGAPEEKTRMRLNLFSSALHCCSMRGEPLQGPSVEETCTGCTATGAMRQYASKKGF